MSQHNSSLLHYSVTTESARRTREAVSAPSVSAAPPPAAPSPAAPPSIARLQTLQKESRRAASPEGTSRGDEISRGDETAASGRAVRSWTSRATWQALARLVAMRVRRLASPQQIAGGVVAVVFAGSLWMMARELSGLQYAEVWGHVTTLSPLLVAAAVGLTLLNFAVLSGYDALALRYVGVRLSYPRIALSAFTGYAVSQAVGNPIITGGSVRYRLYSSWGVSAADIAKAVLFAGTSFWLGFFTLGSILFLFQPMALPDALNLPASPTVLGAACLLPMAGYLGLTAFRDGPVQVRGVTLDVPPRWMLPAQIGLAATDLLLATSVIYVLLPASVEIAFPYMLGVYLMALLAGLISHVPGGLGVFDGIVLMMLTPTVPASTVAAALLAYRVIFHLLPLGLAVFSFCTYEACRARWRGPADPTAAM